MAQLSQIVDISIALSAIASKRATFGVPLLVGQSNRFAEPSRVYDSLAGMVSDGFNICDPEYLGASKLLAQNPRITTFRVGRRSLPSTLRIDITPTAINSSKYSLLIDGEEASYTSDASATVAEIIAGLVSAIDALAPDDWVLSTAYSVGDIVQNDTGKKYKCVSAGTSASSGGPTGTTRNITDNGCKWDYIGCVPTASDETTFLRLVAPSSGVWFAAEIDTADDTVGLSGLSLEITHADPGIATDLATILTSNIAWWSYTVLGASSAEIVAEAAWSETVYKMLIQACPNSESALITEASATGVGKTLKDNAYTYSTLLYKHGMSDFADCALMGERLRFPAGSASWNIASLSGLTADVLTTTQLANLEAKNIGWFTEYGGVTVSYGVKTASGHYLDTIRGRDWFQDEAQKQIFDFLRTAVSTSGKAPYTNRTIGAIKGILFGVAQQGIDRNFILEGSFEAELTYREDQTPTDIAGRTASGISFQFETASAIDRVVITGTIIQ